MNKMIMDDYSIGQARRILNLYTKNILSMIDAISNDARFKMLAVLMERSATFQELRAISALRKTAASHHLNVLKTARLIDKSQRGIYEITDDARKILGNIAYRFFYSNLRKLADIDHANHIITQNLSKEEKTNLIKDMNQKEMRVENINPMRVASVRSIGTNPENHAWQKLKRFAGPLGLLDDLKSHPVYGFNNPDPIPGQTGYGYEFWIKVDPSIQPQDEVTIKDFPGGLYAMCLCNLSKEITDPFLKTHGMLKSWYLLNKWVSDHPIYTSGNHQWLEKHLNGPEGDNDVLLELYHPIKRKD